MAAVTFANLLGTIEDTAAKVGQIVPVIRSTVSSVTTIASGKNPSGSVPPAKTVELGPGAELTPKAVTQFLVIAGGILLVVLFFGVKAGRR